MTEKPQEFAPTPRIRGDSSDSSPVDVKWVQDAARAVLARLAPPMKIPPPDVPRVMDCIPRPNRARMAAYGNEGAAVEEVTLQEDLQYNATLASRADRRQAIDTSPAGVHAWENEFYRDEQTRRDAATVLLHRGYPVLQVAIATGLEASEVRAIKENR
ncbi:MAG: hypothetical protein LAP86_25820 [Acidobacteriia bacterium]|nr:hypothetical protein [Terriglobia bacterium]